MSMLSSLRAYSRLLRHRKAARRQRRFHRRRREGASESALQDFWNARVTGRGGDKASSDG